MRSPFDRPYWTKAIIDDRNSCTAGCNVIRCNLSHSRDPSSSGDSGSVKRAAIAAIVFIYFVGLGWAMGWNSIQYIINAENFPLRVRSTGSSLLMCFHYANRYGISKVCSPA